MASGFSHHVSLPTQWGPFHLYLYGTDSLGPLVLVRGQLNPGCLVRIHSECITGDLFRSVRCDCGEQLDAACQRIQEEGSGMVIYLRGQEGRGIGLAAKLCAYRLQDQGFDTVEANAQLGFPPDARSYHETISILKDWGLPSIRLLTNNPEKSRQLIQAGIQVERVSLQVPTRAENRDYLVTKQKKLGHDLALV